MRYPGMLISLTLIATLHVSGAQAETRYRIQNLGVLEPGHESSFAMAINNRGWVVGNSRPEDARLSKAFIYRNGRMQFLGQLRGDNAFLANDINDRGQVVGFTRDPVHDTQRAFLYSNGRLTDVAGSLSTGIFDNATGINQAGQVTGALSRRAFVYSGNQISFIPVSEATFSAGVSINDRGTVLGFAQFGDDDASAFTYDGHTVNYLPNLPDTLAPFQPTRINNAGQIIGWALSASTGDFKAYLRAGDQVQDLGSLRGLGTQALGLNERGMVVGASGFDDASTHAFVYREGSMHDLNDLLNPAAAARWDLSTAFDINERGQIVGGGILDGQFRAFIATPIPEPGTWALIWAGLGGVACAVRHRRPTA